MEGFSFVILAKDFNPEKYEVLCKIIAQQYCKTGSPTAVLEVHLSIVTKGKCNTQENGKFSVQDFQQKHSYANSDLLGKPATFVLKGLLNDE